jgi:hypothetical protein
MNRTGWIACCSAAIALLALAGLALASRQGEYEGKVKGAAGSEISFKVDRRKGEKNVKVFRFSATKVPTKCGGASDRTEYSLPGYFGLPIKNGGRFHIKDSPSGFRDDSLFVMRGRLTGHGKARGTVRIVDDFDFMPLCDTGRLDWAAHK